MHLTALVAVAFMAYGQTPGRAADLATPAIGRIPAIESRAPATWGLGGMSMVNVTATVNGQTPIMRTLVWDARTVEILSMIGKPGLKREDIQIAQVNGRTWIRVRQMLLLEVTPADARAAHTSVARLASEWLMQVRRVLPQVAPVRGR